MRMADRLGGSAVQVRHTCGGRNQDNPSSRIVTNHRGKAHTRGGVPAKICNPARELFSQMPQRSAADATAPCIFFLPYRSRVFSNASSVFLFSLLREVGSLAARLLRRNSPRSKLCAFPLLREI